MVLSEHNIIKAAKIKRLFNNYLQNNTNKTFSLPIDNG